MRGRGGWCARGDEPTELPPAALVRMNCAAHRWARHEPDVVLFGTGNIAHLHNNIQSILADPLPVATSALVQEYFGHLIGVGLDAPNNAARP